HGRNEVSIQATYCCDRTFGIVPSPQLEFVPPLCSKLRIRDNFYKLENIGLHMLGQQKPYLSSVPFRLTAPFTAKSSPRSIVVPTAMNSLFPVSVLSVSRVTHSRDVTNSL